MRYRNKTYWRIPGGEIQYGHLSRTVTVWWRGKVRLRVQPFAASEAQPSGEIPAPTNPTHAPPNNSTKDNE